MPLVSTFITTSPIRHAPNGVVNLGPILFDGGGVRISLGMIGWKQITHAATEKGPRKLLSALVDSVVEVIFMVVVITESLRCGVQFLGTNRIDIVVGCCLNTCSQIKAPMKLDLPSVSLSSARHEYKSKA